MSEEKKTFEAPAMTTLAIAPVNVAGTSVTNWLSNAYSFDIPDINQAE